MAWYCYTSMWHSEPGVRHPICQVEYLGSHRGGIGGWIVLDDQKRDLYACIYSPDHEIKMVGILSQPRSKHSWYCICDVTFLRVHAHNNASQLVFFDRHDDDRVYHLHDNGLVIWLEPDRPKIDHQSASLFDEIQNTNPGVSITINDHETLVPW